ncbi:hypothetical protein VPNG_09250 [Cytospora leucostoma]|uniref:Uncharacterized protein n=1 Tax=Cytospora leucostoma TaxID=1230097 RepID=A0A423W0M9_9PEZI|nr:hypothetical protein VPNG_09250 [Cytospora leucostoma]
MADKRHRVVSQIHELLEEIWRNSESTRHAYIKEKKGEIGAAWKDHPDYDKIIDISKCVALDADDSELELEPVPPEDQPHINKLQDKLFEGGSFSGYEAEAARVMCKDDESDMWEHEIDTLLQQHELDKDQICQPDTITTLGTLSSGPGRTIVKRKREITAADGSANKAQKKSPEVEVDSVDHKKDSNFEGDEHGSQDGNDSLAGSEDAVAQDDDNLEFNEDQCFEDGEMASSQHDNAEVTKDEHFDDDLSSAKDCEGELNRLEEIYAESVRAVGVILMQQSHILLKRSDLSARVVGLRIREQLADDLGKLRDEMGENKVEMREIKGYLKELVDNITG